jgi:hypothetical protein
MLRLNLPASRAGSISARRAGAGAPLTTALMVAARSDPAVRGLPERHERRRDRRGLRQGAGRRAVLAWEGVGDADGNPIDR